MNLQWSAEARQELRAIRRFIARDSEFYADRTIARIIERAESLLASPRRGHPVHEYPEEALKEIHEPPYRIIYRLSAEVVSIVTIVHFKQHLTLPRG
ncbi:MAG: type II toxin-antitoxin system RelE/ParE family toxin [Opitutaceae bacterium]|nr:type II toxin-antitoxin system RelE/ParE family toxin [Opitutaceae bacterium]